MTSQEFKRWLERHDCTFEPAKGGHLVVRHGDKKAILAMHGKNQEIATGTLNRIKKDLGLKGER